MLLLDLALTPCGSTSPKFVAAVRLIRVWRGLVETLPRAAVCPGLPSDIPLGPS